MPNARPRAASLVLSNGTRITIGGDAAHRLYLGHNFIARMGQKRMAVIGGRTEFERWRQQQLLGWLAMHERPGLPRVLIIGDSIRMRLNDCTGYGLYAYELLLDRYNITHIPHNNGGSSGVRGFIDDWLACRPELVHFNAGLHDLTLTPHGEGGPKHVSPSTYRENLRFIIERIRATSSVEHVIWGRITPVVDEWHNLPNRKLWRCQSDVDRYNEIADEVMTSEHVAVNDIAAPIHEMGVRNGLLVDGVHINPTAAAILGRQVAERVDAAFRPGDPAVRQELRHVPD